ncbi:MAG: LysR family transcriptional regulator, partial [Firmicutes bacterium]|nr:LysR family transcriptional regulator [Bacillota bacterium]
MEIKQLQSFVAVVEYGNFTKAAEKTFTSQPTISTHI